jgi:hypothetical protein
MHEHYDHSKHLSFEATRPACFEVKELPALYNRYTKFNGKIMYLPSVREQVPDKKVLCRVDQENGNLSYLATVGNRYKVILNGDILQTVHGQMISEFGPQYFNGDDDNAVKIKVTLDKNGAHTFVEYAFPQLAVEIETTNGHRTKLLYRQIYKNTFDGSSALTMYVGNIDFFCWNGQISGEYSLIRESHRGHLNIANFADTFRTTMDNYKETSGVYRKMAQAKVKEGVAGDIFDRIVYGNDRNKWPEHTRLSDHLRSLYLDERETRGWNIYSMMSAMTRYAKDGTGVKANPNKKYSREQRVNKWMRSEPWNELCSSYGIDLKVAA